MKIKIIDPVWSKVQGDYSKILPTLSYQSEWWKPGRYKRERKVVTKNLIDRRNGQFLTGLIPLITKTCRTNNIPLKVEGEVEVLTPSNPPKLRPVANFKKFREDQIELIKAAIKNQRGVISAVTGYGKTIVALGLISCFPKAKILFLCHSISILNQTKKELKNFGFKKVSLLGDGNSKLNEKSQIVLASIRTLVGVNHNLWFDKFDITIIDEVHHLHTKDSQYAEVMERNLSPIRIGFTGTLPPTKSGKLFLEGYIGPVIGEVTAQEGIEAGYLAKPIIKLLPVPFSPSVGTLRTYKDIYSKGIVNSRARNRLIVQEANDQIKQKKTVLIMVKEIAHGEIIVEMGADLFGIEIYFVRGKTDGKTREKVREALDDKFIKCVIATAVWREGVNIRSLNCIINGCGGRSELMTLQAIGRGLRAAEGKTTIEVIDFLDRYKYLAQHAIERISIYYDKGWQG